MSFHNGKGSRVFFFRGKKEKILEHFVEYMYLWVNIICLKLKGICLCISFSVDYLVYWSVFFIEKICESIVLCH